MSVNKDLCALCRHYEPLAPSRPQAGRFCAAFLNTGVGVPTANAGLDDPNKCNLFAPLEGKQVEKAKRRLEAQKRRAAQKAEKQEAKRTSPEKKKAKRRRVAEVDGQNRVIGTFEDVESAAADAHLQIQTVYRMCRETIYCRNRQAAGKRAFRWADETEAVICLACGRRIEKYGEFYEIGGVTYCPECVKKGKRYAI